MTLPTFIGGVADEKGASTTITYNIDVSPIAIADGDVVIVAVCSDASNQTFAVAAYNAETWTLLQGPFALGSRGGAIYARVWHSGDSKLFQYRKSVGNADGIVAAVYRGVDFANVVVGTGKARASAPADTTTQQTAPSLTTTRADTKVLAILMEATSAAESGTFLTGPTVPSGWAQDFYRAQTTTINTIEVAHKDMPAAAASGNATFTYQNAQATNAYGVQIGLPGFAASNFPPSAAFTHAETGLQTSVNGASSSDSDGTIASYDWNWGDSDAHGSGASASHRYSTPGTYTVTLTVTDNGGATGSTSQSVTVAYPTTTAKMKTAGGTDRVLVWIAGSAGAKLATARVQVVTEGAKTVSAFIGKAGAVMGHMGESWDEVEGSLEGITRSLMAGVDGIMLSLQRTSDGKFFVLNDAASDGVAYLDRMALGVADGKTLDPRSMTWSQVNGYDQGSYWTKRATSLPRRPFMLLDEFLTKYPTVGPVMIDPKTIPSAYFGAILDIMDANGGPSRFIAKNFATGTGWADAAHARNAAYRTWGYFYAAGIADGSTPLSLASGHWDWIGLDNGGASAQWTAALALGKPVGGHIAKTRADYDLGISKGAQFIMASGVQEARILA